MDFTDYHTRLAAYVLLVDDGAADGQERVLLAWWNGEGHSDPAWSLPGGGIEFDESVRDGLVREVFEETGFHVEPGGLLAEHFFTGRGRTFDGWFRSQRFVFDATITGGELGTTEVDGSTDHAAWVPLAELEGQPRADIVDVALAARAARTVPR
ncbi:NUDIX hydrolase [uncultured Nocardioides sp.]|uniref:NUDIX hydrolase n=1 Tax=uncultured Nocardioides sp. TaxID=198441 RepID=UPI002616BABB|nr:NUDIX hydrolase [uncultured Nocardioides sp.]